MKEKRRYKGLSLRGITMVMAISTIVIAICLIITLILITKRYNDYQTSTEEYANLEKSANDLEQASDFLTEQVRYYVVTGEETYYREYFKEVNETKRREQSLETIKNNIDNDKAYNNLAEALEESNNLMITELYAFRLVIDSLGESTNNYQEVKDVVISDEDKLLSNEEKHTKAIDLVFSVTYNNSKTAIENNVNECIGNIIDQANDDLQKSNRALVVIITFQQVMFFLLVAFIFTDFFLIYYKLVLPLENGSKHIQKGMELKVEGVKEYQILSTIYNETKKRDDASKEVLTYEVEHDKLTGLYNRHGYETLYHRLNLENTAYVLIDVDEFKKINDMYGHAVGDKVLKKVGKTLMKFFDDGNYLCRIGGDEFAILLVDYRADLVSEIKQKNEQIKRILQSKEGGVPQITLSIGVAFGNEKDDTDSLFRKADIALYETKNNGRNGITFFGEDDRQNN